MATNNAAIMDALGTDVAREICSSMAEHYGITPAEAYAELAHPDAHPLLEYLVEPTRSATRLLMLARNLA